MEVRPGYKQTEVGVIPKDWEAAVLDTLGKRRRPAIKAGPFGSSLTKNTYVAEGYKVYGQEQVIRGDHLYGDYYISKARFHELRSCAVEPGDILLSLVGTTGRVLVIPPGAPEGIINPRLVRFSFDQDVVSPAFFRFLFETDAYQALLARSAQGGTMGVLNASLLRPVRIPLPRLTEQEAIAEVLSDADALIESLEQLIAKKRRLKQGALQELLTGKKRLPGFSGEWEVKPLGKIAHVKTGSRNNEDKVENGEYPFFVRSATVERIDTYSYDCEAILVPGEGGIGSIFHYINDRFDVHQRVYAITQFSDEISGKYLFFYMAMNFGAHGTIPRKTTSPSPRKSPLKATMSAGLTLCFMSMASPSACWN